MAVVAQSLDETDIVRTALMVVLRQVDSLAVLRAGTVVGCQRNGLFAGTLEAFNFGLLII